MDKQGRLTKWEELEVGAYYHWVKGKTIYGTLLLKEINRKEGWIKMSNSVTPDGWKNWNWQRRYKKIVDKNPGE